MMIPLECPVCGFRLKGQSTTGYRCVKCHAQYSAKFIRRMRRQHCSDLIERHFSAAVQAVAPKTVETERSTAIIEDDARDIIRALEEAKETAQAKRLEDYLDLAEEAAAPQELVREAADPSTLLQKPAHRQAAQRSLQQRTRARRAGPKASATSGKRSVRARGRSRPASRRR